jgi:hypothetical protein
VHNRRRRRLRRCPPRWGRCREPPRYQPHAGALGMRTHPATGGTPGTMLPASRTRGRREVQEPPWCATARGSPRNESAPRRPCLGLELRAELHEEWPQQGPQVGDGHSCRHPPAQATPSTGGARRCDLRRSRGRGEGGGAHFWRACWGAQRTAGTPSGAAGAAIWGHPPGQSMPKSCPGIRLGQRLGAESVDFGCCEDRRDVSEATTTLPEGPQNDPC